MASRENPSVSAFNRDASDHRGYLYSTGARLSSRIANQRLTDVGLEMVDCRGKTVIDVGCGDGVYTVELYDLAGPESIVGIDPAEGPIKIASEKVGPRRITFSVHSADRLPFPDQSFDVAYVRGVLHHMDAPREAIGEALRVAHSVLVIEPNGYNPVLKVIEKVSRYHREHGERSYRPRRLDRWVQQGGGRIVRRRYAGFVPMFCPDWMARFLKRVEPVMEAVPVLKQLSCAVFVFVAEPVRRQLS